MIKWFCSILLFFLYFLYCCLWYLFPGDRTSETRLLFCCTAVDHVTLISGIFSFKIGQIPFPIGQASCTTSILLREKSKCLWGFHIICDRQLITADPLIYFNSVYISTNGIKVHKNKCKKKPRQRTEAAYGGHVNGHGNVVWVMQRKKKIQWQVSHWRPKRSWDVSLIIGYHSQREGLN